MTSKPYVPDRPKSYADELLAQAAGLKLAHRLAMEDQSFVEYLTGVYPTPEAFAAVTTTNLSYLHMLHHAFSAGKVTAAKQLVADVKSQMAALTKANGG